MHVPRDFKLRGTLTGISDRLISQHIELYRGYVDKLNAINAAYPLTDWTGDTAITDSQAHRQDLGILGTPVAGLDLQPVGPMADAMAVVNREFQEHGGRNFQPNWYFGDEDFWTTDKGISINIPWFLATPDLWRIAGRVARTSFTFDQVLRCLRHELGHAVFFAYELAAHPLWVMVFGDAKVPYGDAYKTDPKSQSYVEYLTNAPSHYAQKHPEEAWAEAFGRWLDMGEGDWRTEFAAWPDALAKMAAVEDICVEVLKLKPTNQYLGRPDSYKKLTGTVADRLGVPRAVQPFSIQGWSEHSELLRREPYYYNAVVLHELYFEQMQAQSPPGIPPLPIPPRVRQALIEGWGTTDSFFLDLRAAAGSTNGWALLVWDRTEKRARIALVEQHHIGVPVGCEVLIAIDCWEHAYAADYGTRKDLYLAAVFQMLDWERVLVRMPFMPLPVDIGWGLEPDATLDPDWEQALVESNARMAANLSAAADIGEDDQVDIGWGLESTEFVDIDGGRFAEHGAGAKVWVEKDMISTKGKPFKRKYLVNQHEVAHAEKVVSGPVDSNGWSVNLTPAQVSKRKAALKFQIKQILSKNPDARIPSHVLFKLGVKDRSELSFASKGPSGTPASAPVAPSTSGVDAQGWSKDLSPFKLSKAKAALKFATKKKLLANPDMEVPAHVLVKLGIKNKTELVKPGIVKPLPAVVPEKLASSAIGLVGALGNLGPGAAGPSIANMYLETHKGAPTHEGEFYAYLSQHVKDPAHLAYWQSDYKSYINTGYSPTKAAGAVHSYLRAKIPGLPPMQVTPSIAPPDPIKPTSIAPKTLAEGEQILSALRGKLGKGSADGVSTDIVAKAFGASKEAASTVHIAVDSWVESQVSRHACIMRFAAVRHMAHINGADVNEALKKEEAAINASTSYTALRPTESELRKLRDEPPSKDLLEGLRGLMRASQAAHSSEEYVTLHRAVKLSKEQYQKALDTGELPSGSLTSFSTSRKVASSFGGYVFTSRVHRSQIAASHQAASALRHEKEVVVFTNHKFAFDYVIESDNVWDLNPDAKGITPINPGSSDWRHIDYDKLAEHGLGSEDRYADREGLVPVVVEIHYASGKTGKAIRYKRPDEAAKMIKEGKATAVGGVGSGEAAPAHGPESRGIPKGKHEHAPDVMADGDGDGVTDAACVGVPAMSVPPPPGIPRLPHLNKNERDAESRFADAYEQHHVAMVAEYRAKLASREVGDAPNIYATDDAKVLSPDYNPQGTTKEIGLAAKGYYNLATHQTANAIAKRAFLQHMDELAALPADDPKRHVLVTSGGVASGKGYALSNVPEAKSVADQVGAVWDAAGEQNATENPWLLKEAKARGLKATFVYVDSDPHETWENPERGVVERARKTGRMVDAQPFADSYGLGATNFKAFHKNNANDPDASFIILRNRGKPTLVDSVPDEALIDRHALKDRALAVVDAKTDLPDYIVQGATAGRRIWGNK